MTKLDPSPDWFIGLDSLNLCQGGHFIDSLTMEVNIIFSIINTIANIINAINITMSEVFPLLEQYLLHIVTIIKIENHNPIFGLWKLAG